MPLSENTKHILLAPFAISHIMDRCWLPGIIGILMFALGFWRHAGWLKVTGLVLAAPIIWVYAVVIFVFIPFAIFDHVWRKIKGR